MRRLPTLYIRNVPTEVYEALKARARREGRSVNAEALKILEDVAERQSSRAELAERLRAYSASFVRKPGDPTAAEVIRLLRDGRADELDRRLSSGNE